MVFSTLLTLAACTGEPPADTAPSEETADTGTACPSDLLVSALWTPAAATLDLSLTGDNLDNATVIWTDTAGGVFSDPALITRWTPPEDFAAFAAEDPEILATVSAPGCDDSAVTVALSLDWEPAQRVVVIYNPSVTGSLEVAQAYQAVHDIGDDALCAIASDTDPQVTLELSGELWPDWVAQAQACVDILGDRISYIVPVYGVPLKVAGRIDDISGSGAKTTVSLDALLAYGETSTTFTAALYNPMYVEGDSLSQSYDAPLTLEKARKQQRRDFPNLWAVSRLDGADAAAALALVERAALAKTTAEAGLLTGTVYVDGNRGDTPPTADDFGSYESGEWNMWGTRYFWEQEGPTGLGPVYPVVWDGNEAEFGTDPAPLTAPDALYYAGWYSYYNYNDAFTWNVGAIGGHLDSCSACDLRDGTWAAEALQRGITATFGAVNEPYVAGMPEYDQFFRYLGGGLSFGAAAYQSTRIGGWMMVWVGDPLYTPYPQP